MLETIIAGTVGITMAFLGFGVWSLVAQTLVGGIVGAIVLWNVSDWRPGFNFSKKHFKDLFSFGLNTIGIKIVEFIKQRSDHLLIGYFLGPVMLGYYTIAFRLLHVMIQLLTGIITSVAFPTFSRLQNDIKKMQIAFYRAVSYSSLIAFPAFLGMSVLAFELVTTLFGEKWLPSVPVMQILAFIGILQSVSLFNFSIFKGTGNPSWHLGLLLISAICNVIGFLIVVNSGITAVAIAYVVISYLLSPLAIFAVKRLIGISVRTYLKQFIAPTIGSLVMIGIILGLKYVISDQVDIYLRLTCYVLAGILSYTLIILLTARNTSRQIFELLSLVLPKTKLKKI
jgi:PST family polysaccharide transporter